MPPLKATWSKVASSSTLQRSSHCVNVVNGKAYVFGGELEPRKPRDNKTFEVDLRAGKGSAIRDLESATVAPCPRVGSASATLNGKIYLFSGRGGEAMHPIEEQGALWVFETASSTWVQASHAAPTESGTVSPPARSYHCATTDGSDRIFIHGGCPASGRLADLWSWRLASRVWVQHEDAPSPPRGGPSIAWHDDLLYRMNGFDGQTEQGGCLDVFSLADNKWTTKTFTADGISGPAPRSVSALLTVSINGAPSLVTLFGEGDPSSQGHAGAGKMFNDVWAWNIERETWSRVVTAGPQPAARGWFDADMIDERSVFVAGGLGESNERLDDAWTLTF